MDSRLRGNDGEGCGEWRYGAGALRGVARPLPLWIADQVRNDVGVVDSEIRSSNMIPNLVSSLVDNTHLSACKVAHVCVGCDIHN